jgi:hypothetical protein
MEAMVYENPFHFTPNFKRLSASSGIAGLVHCEASTRSNPVFSPLDPFWSAGKRPKEPGTAAATSCCFQKNAELNRIGTIGVTILDELTENRRELADRLLCGTPSAGRRDCSVAGQVMRNRNRRRTF